MEEHHADDQSHYEISLTAAQAFLAFVLLLLSLAASFAFGLMIGRGQADERLVVRREPSIVTEGSVLPEKKDSSAGQIVELPVDTETAEVTDTAATSTTATDATVVEEGTSTVAPVLTETAPAATETAAPAATETAATPKPVAPAPAKPAAATTGATTPAAEPAKPAPVRAAEIQMFSSSDKAKAELMAAKLIEAKFMRAYVQRVLNGNTMTYRVRVPFATEADARAALPKLKEISPGAWVDVK